MADGVGRDDTGDETVAVKQVEVVGAGVDYDGLRIAQHQFTGRCNDRGQV